MMEIESFEQNLEETNNLYLKLLGERSSLLKKHTQKTKELEQLREDSVEFLKVKLVLEGLIKDYIGFQLDKIGEYVTYGLKTVINDQKLEFKCAITTKMNKPWVDFITVLKDGEESIEGPVMEGFGGSVAQIESLILRVLAVLQLKLYPVLFLDESLNAVSPDYIPNLSLLLKELTKQLKIKILLVTHNKEILAHADRIYKAVDTKNNGLILEQLNPMQLD